MHVDWKFSGDGILAFLGGASALFGVWLSNRRSTQNLQRQLDEEKQARKDEQRRQTVALAKTFVFEIDDFYQYFVKGLRHTLAKLDLNHCDLPRLYPLPPSAFGVYRQNTGRVGDLGDEAAAKLIHLYSFIADFAMAYEEYRRAFERVIDERRPRPEDNTEARQLLRDNYDVLARLTEQAYRTCQSLCSLAQVPFVAPGIAIASENIADLERSVAATIRAKMRKEHVNSLIDNAQTH